MASRKRTTRILRATKNQVANQLQALMPGLTGSQILTLTRSPDATFWQAQVSSGFSSFNGIEQDIESWVEFDNEFFVTNLLAGVDNTITAAMILDIRVSASDSTKIEVELKRS